MDTLYRTIICTTDGDVVFLQSAAYIRPELDRLDSGKGLQALTSLPCWCITALC